MTGLSLGDVIGRDMSEFGRAASRLSLYQELVLKWNPVINVVAKSTESVIWQRHFLDSAQIFQDLPDAARDWVDLGSGGGFPGLVVAILADDLAPRLRVTLVESDKRKSVFLREVIRETGISATVRSERIENLPSGMADVVSARALSSLGMLCQHAEKLLRPAGTAIFLKGESAESEIALARQSWSFRLDLRPSITERHASVLVLKDLRRA